MKRSVSHVWLRPLDQRQSMLTVNEFLGHHPGQRASWILGDVCTFLTPSGTTVPLERALDALQESWVLRSREVKKRRAA